MGKPDSEWRTSSTYFMPSDDEVLRRIDDRVSALTVIKKSHQELAQVLRYEPPDEPYRSFYGLDRWWDGMWGWPQARQGEQYVAHTDYFDPEMYAQNEDVQKMIKRGLFNRSLNIRADG